MKSYQEMFMEAYGFLRKETDKLFEKKKSEVDLYIEQKINEVTQDLDKRYSSQMICCPRPFCGCEAPDCKARKVGE